MTAVLRVRDLEVTFGTGPNPTRAVDGVSFDLLAGETLGLVGESGSGKTVTALALLRLIDAPGKIAPGSVVEYRDRNLMTLPPAELRRVRGAEIAMVFQEPGTSLNPVLRVGLQITETVQAHRSVSARAARARAIELLDLVGVPEPEIRVDAYPHELSGGMQQRVMLAMALSCEPKVLIADEPTTALDVTVQAQVLKLLMDIKQQLGMAMLLISHDLGIVAHLADRIAIMYGGQLTEVAPAATMFSDAAHPYTRALLDATPRLDRTLDRLPTIPGTVPSATHWPRGCRFHPRCPHVWDRCRESPPVLTATGDHRAVRCWLTDEPNRRTA
jgi:oligopeptide/dipeptide ABC transporter ATP-binding protein